MTKLQAIVMAVTAALAALPACEWGGGPGAANKVLPPDAPKVMRDAGSGSRDAARLDSSGGIDAPAATGGAHLLLTEIALQSTELIEIYNPTGATVDLTTYYVANSGNYFQLPGGAPSIPFDHFIVQFAAGSTIAAGAVITIATGTAADFNTAFGADPTYSITDGTVTQVAGSGTPQLTNSGAIVVLFSWDGSSGVVKDVDMMIAGVPNATNALVDKSGVTQNGATYATDVDTIAAQPSAPGAGVSTKRTSAETGHETQAGTGNGITGHDETSENTAVTWDTTFTAPTPGVVPGGF